MRLFGWRRVEFLAPEQWRLIADSGRWDNAYFILGDEYENPRLEVTWRKMKLPKGGLAKLLQIYLKNLRKQLSKELGKRAARELEVSEPRERLVAGHPALSCTLSLRGGVSSVNLWRCGDTGRVVLAQLNYREAERGEYLQLEERLLSSFKCHPGSQVLWTPGPLSFHLPYTYALVEGSLNPLFSYLQYAAPRESRYLIIAWSEMSSRVLPQYGGSLKKWYAEAVVKNVLGGLRGYRLKFKESSGEGGRVAVLEGHSIVMLPFVLKKVYGIAWLSGEMMLSLTTVSFAEQFDDALRDLWSVERQVRGG